MDKAHLRTQIRLLRRDVAPLERAAFGGQIALYAQKLMDLVPPQLRQDLPAIATYVPLPTEPDVRFCNEYLAQEGYQLLAPIVGARRELHWGELTDASNDSNLSEGPFGLQEPSHALGVGNAPLLDHPGVWLILLPALAVSPEGIRLGQGGGYYDTLFEHLPAFTAGGPLRVAVTYSWEDQLGEVGAVAQPHDARVDAVLTPQELRIISPGSE